MTGRALGFTGTREGISDHQRAQLTMLILAGNWSEFHHGDCVGADADAHEIAKAAGLRIIVHPPLNEAYRAFVPQAEVAEFRPADEYLSRNRDIVDESALLIACPRSDVEERRSGTWSTVRYARRTGRPVLVLQRDEVTE